MSPDRLADAEIQTGRERPQAGGPLAASLPDLLGVAEVMARYGVRDRRTARRIMSDAGSFIIRGNAYVYADDLAAFERSNRSTTTTRHRGEPPTRPRRSRKARNSAETGFGLARHWWQQPSDAN